MNESMIASWTLEVIKAFDSRNWKKLAMLCNHSEHGEGARQALVMRFGELTADQERFLKGLYAQKGAYDIAKGVEQQWRMNKIASIDARTDISPLRRLFDQANVWRELPITREFLIEFGQVVAERINHEEYQLEELPGVVFECGWRSPEQPGDAGEWVVSQVHVLSGLQADVLQRLLKAGKYLIAEAAEKAWKSGKLYYIDSRENVSKKLRADFNKANRGE